MLYLKQSTAVTLKIGPFLDETDGITPEPGLTITQAEVRISKNGADIAQKNEAANCTYDEVGVYACPIDTTDTNTLGRLQLWIIEAGACPVWHDYMVIEAETYDMFYGTGILEDTLPLTEALRVILAFAAGKLSGGGTTTRYFRDVADSKPRITATIDTSGGRSAIILDGT